MQAALPFAPRITDPPRWQPSDLQKEVGRQLALTARRLADAPSGLTSIILSGPPGSGKSRLAEETFTGEQPIDAAPLDVAGIPPLELFAEINTAAAARVVHILEAARPPAHWFAEGEAPPPDLVSRLDAMPSLRLERPGIEALRPILEEECALHGHRMNPGETDAVLERLPKEFGAPRRFCRALDAAGLMPSRKALLQWAVEQAHLAPAGNQDGGS